MDVSKSLSINCLTVVLFTETFTKSFKKRSYQWICKWNWSPRRPVLFLLTSVRRAQRKETAVLNVGRLTLQLGDLVQSRYSYYYPWVTIFTPIIDHSFVSKKGSRRRKRRDASHREIFITDRHLSIIESSISIMWHEVSRILSKDFSVIRRKGDDTKQKWELSKRIKGSEVRLTFRKEDEEYGKD